MLRIRTWQPELAGALLTLLSAIVLYGCGGGGGGGGGPTGTPIADTAQAYWNAEAAARWAFEVSDTRPGHPASRSNLVTVAGTTTVGGTLATRFAHTSSLTDTQPGEELRYYDGAAIRVTGGLSLDPALPPVSGSYAELPAPLVGGVPITVLDRTESFDIDGDGIADPIRIVAVVTLGTEAGRSVPAGDFSNVLRAVTEVTATVTSSLLGQPISATAIETVWYAPGVGPIERRFVDPNFTAPTNVATERLSGVSLVALKAGTVPGIVALDSIGAGTSSELAGIPAIATDGTNVLVVSRAVDSLGSSVSLVGALLGPDGNAIAQPTLVGASSGGYLQLRSAAVFDGQNYQVFGVRPDGVMVGQRVSGAGAVLGPSLGTPVPGIASGSIGAFAAASSGSEVLLVWQRFDGASPGSPWLTEGQVIDRGGNSASAVFSLGRGEASLDVAWSSGRYLIAAGIGGSLWTARVDAAGALQPPASWQALAAGSASFGLTDPKVVAHPDGFLIGWNAWDQAPNVVGGSRLAARRMSVDGVALDAADIAIDATSTPDRSAVALAGGSAGLLAGWVVGYVFDPTPSANRARGVRAAWAAGPPAFGAPASYATSVTASGQPRNAYPVAAAAGGNFVFAWLEDRQSGATPSDRVVATFVYPRAVR